MVSTKCPPEAHLLALVHPQAKSLTQPPRPRVHALTHCEIDGHALGTHPRCRRCRILVGPHHYRQTLTDGYCEHCYLDVRRRRLGACEVGE